MNITEVDDVDDALREWARGVYTEEAAVELLVRSGWTRRTSFLGDVVVGYQEPGTHPWVDWESLGQILTGDRDSGILAASGGELRVLRIAHSLAAGELGALVPGLDRDVTAMVLAAVAHANGSHEHSGAPTPDPAGRLVETGSGKRFSVALLPSLHPWPGLPPLIEGNDGRPGGVPTFGHRRAEPDWLEPEPLPESAGSQRTTLK